MFFTHGIHDSAPGARIPYMEQIYNIGYTTVSLIFITNAVGFILTAPLVQAIEHRFRRARAYMFAGSLNAVAFIAIISKPPFPVVVVSFFLPEFRMAFNLALNSVFRANLSRGTVILGFMHGSYGVGDTLAPPISTAIISKGIQWPHFYLVPLSRVLIGIGFPGWAFWSYEKDTLVPLLTVLERTASHQAVEAGEPTRAQLLTRGIKNRTTLLGALFNFTCQGAEVSISGYVISFLINYRNGNPAQAGYVTAGF